MNFRRILVVSFLILLPSINVHAQQPDPFYAGEQLEQRVDSLYRQMSLDEKIGQLFMMRIPSEFTPDNLKIVDHYIRDLHMGGMGYLKGHPTDHLRMNNYIQAHSSIPVITAIDAEWGLSMRLDSVAAFPWNMTLGALRNDSLVYRIGRRIGEQMAALGYAMNYAPDVDINTNPLNPIIGNRSFGEDKHNVARKGFAMMSGLQSVNILTTAKHFPGHGDTSQDSHKTLPTVSFSAERIDSTELYPYKYLIPRFLTGVMVAHLRVPALDYTGVPSTLSPRIVDGILKKRLGFRGLILTDAMVMKGVSEFTSPEEADLRAFLAGNDMILFSADPDKSFHYFKEAYRKGIISEQRLAESVKKILKAKYWSGLFDYHPKSPDAVKKLSTAADSALIQTAYEQAVTLVKNHNHFLPWVDVEQKTALVSLGEKAGNSDDLLAYMNKYGPTDKVPVADEGDLNKLDAYDRVVVAVLKNTDNPWKPYRLDEQTRHLIDRIASRKPTAVIIFTSPYALLPWKDELPGEAVAVAYENNEFTRKIVPQLLFGALPFRGQLPVSINARYPRGTGIETKALGRLAYGFPEQEDMDSRRLAKVDSLMQFMIDTMAAPGGVVLAARNGRVVFLKAYGKHRYEYDEPMHTDDVFDLASVTKVMAATTSMMRIYDEGGFRLTDSLGTLLPYLKGSNKDTLDVISVLSHYARIKSWIPFYLQTYDTLSRKPLKVVPSRRYYRRKPSPEFNIKVAENMYLISTYPDSIWQQIKDAPQYEKRKYVYSGLPFYLWKKFMLERYGTDIDRYTDSVFYKPMGARSLTFNAWKNTPRHKIVPTEKDDYWRHQLLVGYVHDMGAAMLNGVNGNAGLFGNAEDLAKMMQMHLQGGYYGGRRYISDSTERAFRHRYFEKDSVRRGLGWDMPQFKGQVGPTFEEIPWESFGHQGFTGTMIWADPEENIIYIFLSNRVYPTMNNPLLPRLNIRSEVQRLIYLALKHPLHDYRDQYKLKGIPYPWEKNKHH